MTQPTPAQMIADLRAGHYKGHGGATVLARDLGVTQRTVKWWMDGREPSFAHRQALRALWEKHAAGGGEDAH